MTRILLPMLPMLPMWLTLLAPAGAAAQCTSGPDEPFGKFVGAFASDKRFAMARTHYPLPMRRHPKGDGEPAPGATGVETRLRQDEDAQAPPLAGYARANGLQLRVASSDAAQATLRMEKPDTDWLLTYHFIRDGRCWFLVRIEDHSL